MRTIAYNDVVDAVRQLCEEICMELPADVEAALQKAAEAETHARACRILRQLLENAQIAREQRIPLCQDTGLAVVFVEQGAQTQLVSRERVDATLFDAIHEGVAAGYRELLRKSVVAEPLHERKNTQTNTPAVIHYDQVPGDSLRITLMAKGGGCENKSQFRMFNPTEEKETILQWVVQVVREAGANACPPFVVGVGVGGDFEQCCLISKKALLRPLDQAQDDPFYAQMENDLLERINALGVGPQGLGGDTTALAVKVETAPCHIASLPVAVNIECHSHRHKTLRL